MVGSLSHTQDDVGALSIEGSAIFAFLVEARRGDTHMQTNPFATEAAEYAHLRPTYPEKLFELLATIVASRNIAWDCATARRRRTWRDTSGKSWRPMRVGR
jgi:hypothetical protein